MSEFLEIVLELIFNVICETAELWLGDFSWPDTRAGGIVLGVVILILGGVIWWEVH